MILSNSWNNKFILVRIRFCSFKGGKGTYIFSRFEREILNLVVPVQLSLINSKYLFDCV